MTASTIAWLAALFSASTVLVSAACGATNAGFGAGLSADAARPGQTVRSSKPRHATRAPVQDIQQLTGDDAAFALDVLHTAATGQNFFVSPHSISIALAMTYGGARERTAAQMAHALHFTLPPERLHPTFGSLELELARRSQRWLESGQSFKLNILNSLWGQRDWRFLDSYLDLLSENYGADLSLLDFAKDPEGARSAINGWVSDQTERRIPELLPAGIVTSATVLVLTNAIYFNASWKKRFVLGATSDGAFTKLDGSSVTARLMHQTESHRYGEGDGWQALELLYAGDDVSMLVLLPAKGRFEDFRTELDSARLSTIIGALETRLVDVALPKFRFSTQLGVKSTLKTLGMNDAFEAKVADLSGMDGTRNLFIQDVVHEAFVAVDERGTEAAASTAVVVGRMSAPQRATFTADRPFVVVIRDNPTGAVLFVGQVTSP